MKLGTTLLGVAVLGALFGTAALPVAGLPACDGRGAEPVVYGVVRAEARIGADCVSTSAQRDVDCRALPLAADAQGITVWYKPLSCGAGFVAQPQLPQPSQGPEACEPLIVVGPPGIHIVVGKGCAPVEICDPWIPRVCEH